MILEESLSARRAWIEMHEALPAACPMHPSLSARRAWIEIYNQRIHQKEKKSLSARRAWIEIYNQRIHQKEKKVALRKESVDRNCDDVPD